MAKRYFYRFETSTDLGKLFRRWWNEFVKVERTRNIFLGKVGAEGWQDDDNVLAGGVLAVSFPEDKNVNTRIWRPSHKDADGVQMYVPNVERRTGYMILPRKGFKPSDTASRVYDKRLHTFAHAVSQYTLAQWAEKAGVQLTGDKQKDAERVNNALKDAQLAHYVEFYVQDFDPETIDKHTRIPWWVREAVRIEVARVKLPTISPDSLYNLMQAESPLQEGQTHAVVSEQVPQFYEWGGRYYLAISRRCCHEKLEEITAETFSLKLTTLRQAQRANDEQRN